MFLLCFAMLCYVLLCLLCFAMFCYVFAMFCCVFVMFLLCFAMFCYVLLCFATQTLSVGPCVSVPWLLFKVLSCPRAHSVQFGTYFVQIRLTGADLLVFIQVFTCFYRLCIHFYMFLIGFIQVFVCFIQVFMCFIQVFIAPVNKVLFFERMGRGYLGFGRNLVFFFLQASRSLLYSSGTLETTRNQKRTNFNLIYKFNKS